MAEEQAPGGGRNAKAPREKALDEIDYAIMSHLQEDARLSPKELETALEKIGLPIKQGACRNRVTSLEERKIIKGVKAILDHTRLGLPQLCFMPVKLHKKSHQTIGQFLSIVVEHPNVVEIHEVAGDYDYLLKLRVPAMDVAFRISKMLIAVEGIEVKTVTGGATIKETTALRLPWRQRFQDGRLQANVPNGEDTVEKE